MSNADVPKERDVRIPAVQRGLYKTIATLQARVEELEHRLEWYETGFRPPVQPPTDQWMTLLDTKGEE